MQKGNKPSFSTSKLRVILDTNLLLSATIIPESTPDKIIQSWKKDSFILLVSQLLIDELEDVTSKKKFLSHYLSFKGRSEELIASLKGSAELIEPVSKKDLPIHSRDPEDDFMLASGLGGNADYLVTGDQDLLVLNGNPRIGNFKIVKASEFLDFLNKQN